jgi:hypothetical protein
MGMPEIVLTIRLTDEDWDRAMRGWRCPVLSIPGAVVDAVYVEGIRVDSARYEVLAQNTFLRWIASDQPPRIAVSIKLTEALSLGSETERWKRLAVVLPVAATIVAAGISGFATYRSRTSEVHTASHPSDTQDSHAVQPANTGSSQAQSSPTRSNVSAIDAININNTTFTSAFPIEVGKTYRSRFLGDDASRYFEFRQANGGHNLNVELSLVGTEPDVGPSISIYDMSRTKLFSRYHKTNDDRTIRWSVPLMPGDYVAEIRPASFGGGYAEFLLSLTTE